MLIPHFPETENFKGGRSPELLATTRRTSQPPLKGLKIQLQDNFKPHSRDYIMPLNSRFLIILLIFGLAACDSGKEVRAVGPAAPAQELTNNGAETSTESSRDFSSLPSPYNEADYALGRRTFKFCGSCHTLKEGGPDLVGPNLFGIIGREAGSRPGFNYSTALQEASFRWTPEKLEEWLNNPRTFLPGNNMTFSGVHRQDARHAVIAYVMHETGYGPESETTATP